MEDEKLPYGMDDSDVDQGSGASGADEAHEAEIEKDIVHDPDESPDGDEAAEKVDEPSGDEGEPAEDEGFAENELEYMRQFGELPDGVKSVADLVKNHTEALKEMKRAQARLQALEANESERPARGDSRSDPNGVQGKEQQRLFAPNPVSTLAEQWKKSGIFRDEEQAALFSAQAQMVDYAITPQLEMAERVMDNMANHLGYLDRQVKNMLWQAVDEKLRNSVKRSEIDAVMKKYGHSSYAAAIKFYATEIRPDLFPKLFGQQSQPANKGNKNGQQFKKMKFPAARRDGQPGGAPSGQGLYKKFLNQDGSDLDNDKLMSVPEKMQDAIISAFEKATRNRR